jgi:hypothetical protein
MLTEKDLFPDDIAPLPPPPAGPRRLARGSWPPIDLTLELDALKVREIPAPAGWSRVESIRLPARVRVLDRAATAVVGALAVLAGGLVTLLLI